MQPFQERPLFLQSLDVHRTEWVVVFAYFDETGTSGGAERLTAVAGYLFTAEGADSFWELYKKNVEPLIPPDEDGVRMFHASQCILGYPPFNVLLVDEREHIVNQLVAAIQNSVTMGTVVAIE